MPRVMPKALQIQKLKQFLKKKGIEPDTVDLEALVDSKLTYTENKKRIMEILGLKGRGYTVKAKALKKIEIKLQEIYDTIRQALDFHEMRSEKSKILDEKKKARVPKDPELWFKHPERYDLPTVDHPSMSLDDYIKQLMKPKKKAKGKAKKNKTKTKTKTKAKRGKK